MIRKISKTLKRICWDVSAFIFFGNIQKRLGYKRNAKLLIIHADDFGLTGSENRATIEAFEKGIVKSASIMVPCRGFEGASEYARNQFGIDMGIHLTLTSEYDTYKWGPVLPLAEVKSLVDENGNFFKNKKYLLANYRPEEVKKELRAQIQMALKARVKLTHLDSHMFITTSNDEILNICINLGKEFGLPLLLTKELPWRYLLRKNLLTVDQLLYAKPEDNNNLDGFYSKTLQSLKSGLNCILVHTAYDDKEMQKLTTGMISHGSEWREADFKFFTSDECRKLIRDNKIQLITWKEILDKLILQKT